MGAIRLEARRARAGRSGVLVGGSNPLAPTNAPDVTHSGSGGGPSSYGFVAALDRLPTSADTEARTMNALLPRILRVAAIAAIGLIAAACGAYGSGGGAAGTGPAASVRLGSPTIGTATSATLGAYLTGPNGLTLYIKTSDTANTSTCTGACLSSWPALTVTAGQNAVARTRVTGTRRPFARANGTAHVTYNRLPRFYLVSHTQGSGT